MIFKADVPELQAAAGGFQSKPFPSPEFEELFRQNPTQTIVSACAGINAFVDEGVDAVVKGMDAENKSMACFGCVKAHCCRQPLYTTIVEAGGIAAHIVAKKRNTKAFRRKLLAAGELMEALGSIKYWAQQRPCVFQVGELCGVYDVRPPSCRKHYSLEKTPERCRPDVEAPAGILEFEDLDKNMLGVAAWIVGLAGIPADAFIVRALPRHVCTLLQMAADPVRAVHILRANVVLPESRVAAVKEELV